MKKALITLSITAIAAISGYMYWLQTPQYSLIQIQDALKNKDIYAFQQYVDIDGIINRGVDVYVVHGMKGEDSGFGQAFAVGMVEMMKPNLIARAKSEVIGFVESKSSVNNSMRQKYDEGGVAIDYDIRKQGNIAFLIIDIKNLETNKSMTAEFKLRKVGDYWRVIEFSNLNDILIVMEEEEKEKIAEANKAISPRLEIVQFTRAEKRNFRKSKWSSEDMKLKVYLTNNGQENMKKLDVELDVLYPSGEIVKTISLAISELGAGTSAEFSWVIDLNQFNDADEKMKKLNDGEIYFNARVTSFKTDSGETVALVTKV